jgi:hypothetical protein
MQHSKAVYAAINIQYTEYSTSIDGTLPIGKPDHVPKGSSQLAADTDVPHTASTFRLTADPFGSNQKRRTPMIKMFSTMTVCGLLMTSAAHAQSGQPIQAKVPFAFIAQNTMLASGTYQLTYNTTAHRLMIRGLNQNAKSAFATAVPTSASSSRDEFGKLVFRCYEKTCYLAQVWQGSIGSGRGLEVRHAEPSGKLALATRVVSITIPVK